jgi:very-short-patch-repair endonuclease
MTEAEKRLWGELRELGRQHPIGTYIVDFACPASKLAIELDGGQHALRTSADEARSSEIASNGYRVMRFWNGDVMENLAGVMETITRDLAICLSAPGAERGGDEVGESSAPAEIHLTLPAANATGPLPLPPKGLRGP